MTAEEKLNQILQMLNEHDELESQSVEIRTNHGWVDLRDLIEDSD